VRPFSTRDAVPFPSRELCVLCTAIGCPSQRMRILWAEWPRPGPNRQRQRCDRTNLNGCVRRWRRMQCGASWLMCTLVCDRMRVLTLTQASLVLSRLTRTLTRRFQ
jgi:hypothetical protein